MASAGEGRHAAADRPVAARRCTAFDSTDNAVTLVHYLVAWFLLRATRFGASMTVEAEPSSVNLFLLVRR